MAIDRMHWFTTKIIPLIYDDSLSYYEFLCKVLVKMNECIDTVNDMSAELTNFETWTRRNGCTFTSSMVAMRPSIG